MSLLRSAIRRIELKEDGLFAENRDNQPVPPEQQTWTRTQYCAIFAFTTFIVSAWSSGAALLGLGLSVWQAVLAEAIATVFIIITLVAVGIEGVDWRIAAPFTSRVVWGLRGCRIPIALLLVANSVFYSVQLQYGSQCLKVVIAAIAPAFLNMGARLDDSVSVSDFICIILFWCATLPLHCMSVAKWKWPSRVASVAVLVTFVSLTIVCLTKAGGAGPLLNDPYDLVGVTEIPKGAKLVWACVWATSIHAGNMGALQQANTTRFAARPGYQIPAQVTAALCLLLVSVMGILSASAAVVIFPDEKKLLWTPADLLFAFIRDGGKGARAAAFFAGLACCATQAALNVSGNGWQAGINLSSLFPRLFNVRRGALLCAAVGLAMNPWRLAGSSSAFVRVLTGMSILFAAPTGILIADYYLVRKRKLKVSHLYMPDSRSIYWYWRGFNIRTVVIWFLIVIPLLPGFVQRVSSNSIRLPEGLNRVYYLSYFLGLFGASSIYVLLCKIFPIHGLGQTDLDEDVGGKSAQEEETILEGEVTLAEKGLTDVSRRTSGTLEGELEKV